MSFCLLPCGRCHVLYFEARPPALFGCVGRIANSGPPLDVPGKPVGRFLAANNEVLEGDLSQNAASGKAIAFELTNESGLAKSG